MCLEWCACAIAHHSHFPMAHHGPMAWLEVLQLLEVFFVSNLFLDDLALRMALEAHLERGNRGDGGPAPVTMELLGSPWAGHGWPSDFWVSLFFFKKVDLYHQGEEVLIVNYRFLQAQW